MKSPRTQREPRRLSFNETIFELTAALLLGTALYFLLFACVESVIIPFVRGLLGEADQGGGIVISYRNPSFTPPYVKFNGYLLQYGHVLSVLGTLVLGAVVVILLVAYARRETQQAPVEEGAEIRACPECLSLIPAAARRCARCRAQVQPQTAPGDTWT